MAWAAPTRLGQRLRDIPLLRTGEALESVPGMVITQHPGMAVRYSALQRASLDQRVVLDLGLQPLFLTFTHL